MKTIKMNKVLIALDYSPTAQKVAEIGFTLANSMNAQVILLHVVSNFVYYSSSQFSPIMGFNGYVELEKSQKHNEEELRKASYQFLEKSKQHLGDEKIQVVVKEGEKSETILGIAKKLKVDLIVMGSHSQKWLESIIMGSVTEEVLRKTLIPLFIVPTKKNN